jgi:CTP synthase
VISLLEEQVDVKNYGGTMRLGRSESVAESGTRIFRAYKEQRIFERHRHRYEFANVYRPEMTTSGLRIAALTPDKSLVECVEWPDHPWGLGVQFHPEFKSKPTAANPLFRDFIAAVRDRLPVN